MSQGALFDDSPGAATNGEKRAATSKQQLSTTVKSVRDTLRTDAGLYGDTDRLPQLTWLLFLKFLDDHELAQEDEWGDEYEPVITEPYRWRDWAAVANVSQRLTGDELLTFVNEGLLPYLRGLSGPTARDIRTVVGAIFQGTYNRIRSGYILREVVDKLSAIDFNSSDDIHTVSLFYETMLREMRDAAGDAGEFYTPRPVVRLIVDRLNPRLGETVLDPACGTGGFLVEAYEHMKGEARDRAQRRTLQDSIVGTEKKATPYLLGIMNLLLHGIEQPNVSERNALLTNIRQIKEAERVDVIATNPPFGGAEEEGVLNNFPEGMRSQETALLFFQYVMAMLKRSGGRCGIVLPNGFLFGGGVAAEIKKQLLQRFNLHTVVRLPNGVFAPYTSIPTNLLFFDACALSADGPCTKEVWYYEQPLPEGRKNYTKTRSLEFEEFAQLREWWDNREENEYAWRVSIQQIQTNFYNLDIKNPNTLAALVHRPPEQLVEDILHKEQHILAALTGPSGKSAARLSSPRHGASRANPSVGRHIWKVHASSRIGLDLPDGPLTEMSQNSWQKRSTSEPWSTTQLTRVLHPVSRPEPVDPDKRYRILGAHWYAEGLYVKDVKPGRTIQAKSGFRTVIVIVK